jgi:hypothetical protein
MMLKSRFYQVDRNQEHNIVWIEDDCDGNGDATMSVTNDAENVVKWFRQIYGNGVRIVYRDTLMEWWEIVWIIDYTSHNRDVEILFKPWHGLEWDILSRKD